MNNTPNNTAPGPDPIDAALAGRRDLIENCFLRVADAAWHEGRAAGRREQLAAMNGQGLPREVSPYAEQLRLKMKAAQS